MHQDKENTKPAYDRSAEAICTTVQQLLASGNMTPDLAGLARECIQSCSSVQTTKADPMSLIFEANHGTRTNGAGETVTADTDDRFTAKLNIPLGDRTITSIKKQGTGSAGCTHLGNDNANGFSPPSAPFGEDTKLPVKGHDMQSPFSPSTVPNGQPQQIKSLAR